MQAVNKVSFKSLKTGVTDTMKANHTISLKLTHEVWQKIWRGKNAKSQISSRGDTFSIQLAVVILEIVALQEE